MNLSDSYWTGDDRELVYRKLASIVMTEVRKGPGVASITYGHPTLFDDVYLSLVRRCRRAGLKCVVLPAVSCLDTLGIDFGSPGLVLFEATDLVLNRRKMNSELHTLVMQFGEFDIDTTIEEIEKTGTSFQKLDRYWQKYYPHGHKMVVCFSNDGDGAEKISIGVGELQKMTHWISVGPTLYIPPK